MPFCVWFVSSIIIPSKFIHVVTNGKIFFFVMAQYYSTVYIYHIFFIHSSADGHLGCDRVLAIVNNAAMNVGVQRALWDSDFIFSNTHPEVKLLDHVIVLFLIFCRVFRLFFIMPVPIYILATAYTFLLSASLSPAFVLSYDDSYLNRYMEIYHCGLGLHFPDE